MHDRILIVDDDTNLLQAMRRQLFDVYDVATAEGGAAALELTDNEAPFAVVLSDMRMPGMDGIEFLKLFQIRSKHTVRVMLTGNADQQTAIDAVNEGHIFRFLKKPCPETTLRAAIEACIEQYRLIVAERELLSKTVAGTVKAFTEILSLLNPKAFALASRARRLARSVAERLELDRPWEIEMAAMLSQVGWVTVPDESLFSQSNRDLPNPARVSYDLVKDIPRLEGVAHILANSQQESAEPTEFGAESQGGPLGASVLKLVLEYEALIDSGLKSADAIQELRTKHDNPAANILELLADAVANDDAWNIDIVSPERLAEGAILAKDVMTSDGRLLLRSGQEISEPLRQRLLDISKRTELTEEIHVLGERVPETSNCTLPSSFLLN